MTRWTPSRSSSGPSIAGSFIGSSIARALLNDYVADGSEAADAGDAGGDPGAEAVDPGAGDAGFDGGMGDFGGDLGSS